MKLTQIGSNQNEVTIGGNTVLFSYSTPVAAHVDGKGWYRTEKHHSKTTSKHINAWIPEGCTVAVKPQEFFNNLGK